MKFRILESVIVRLSASLARLNRTKLGTRTRNLALSFFSVGMGNATCSWSDDEHLSSTHAAVCTASTTRRLGRRNRSNRRQNQSKWLRPLSFRSPSSSAATAFTARRLERMERSARESILFQYKSRKVTMGTSFRLRGSGQVQNNRSFQANGNVEGDR